MADVDERIDRLTGRVDELERDHVRWLAVARVQSDDRAAVLMWALVCIMIGALMVVRVIRLDRTAPHVAAAGSSGRAS